MKNKTSQYYKIFLNYANVLLFRLILNKKRVAMSNYSLDISVWLHKINANLNTKFLYCK